MDYYRTPLNIVRVFETNTRNLSLQNEKDSIDQNLELIITTCPGEHKYDPEFGCRIWDLDFERVVSKSRWENEFNDHITEAIRKYEPRVCEVEPKIGFFDTQKELDLSGTTTIRKRVDIQIDAKVMSTGAKCCFYYSLYLGPLSSD